VVGWVEGRNPTTRQCLEPIFCWVSFHSTQPTLELITPRVLGSIEEARELTGKFEKSVDRMKKYMKEQTREIIK